MTIRLLIVITCMFTLYGCSATRPATEPVADRERPAPPVDFSSMTEPPEDWFHLDEEQTRFRGISSQRAYETLLSGLSPEKEVIVAVIDGGVDITHEDLKNVLWVNEGEIPGNGKDDDGNGYVDDVHGWNFIGGADGRNVNHDTFELTRLYRRLNRQFGEADTTVLSAEQRESYRSYRQIRAEYEEKIYELNQQYSNISSLEESMLQADAMLQQHFGDTAYTYEQVQSMEPENQEMNFAKNVMMYVLEHNIDSTLIAEQKKQIYEFAKYGYNPEFRTRHIVGDNYEDTAERFYGNNDVAGPDPSHGTHVAGIIAAERDNGVGINGVAVNTRIMAIRAVPNGDERDKDVANAIRYAVDNGAHIINMSFGKAYSPYKEAVEQAIRYADEHGVLMVHGAGNEAKNTDHYPSYPTDRYGSAPGDSTATLWLTVGATSWKPDEEFIAGFSNYGDRTVDLFAPGVDIYSTMPGNEYERQDGTSMASPVVAGAAALIMAYYPELSPQQVRQLIFENTAKYPNQHVIVPNEGNPAESERAPFPQLSASDGVLNVYKALQAAGEWVNE